MDDPNAYCKPTRPHPLDASNSLQHGAFHLQDGDLTNQKMGRQSQARDSAIRKCMQFGGFWKAQSHSDTARTQPNLVQRAVDGTGQIAFDKNKDCGVCRAKYRNERVPHRAHDPRCGDNITTGGHSAVAVASNNFSKQLKRHFLAPMKHPEKEKQLTGGSTLGVDHYLTRSMKKKKVESGKAPTLEPTASAMENVANDTCC